MDIFNIEYLELLLNLLPAFCGFAIYRINNKIDLNEHIGTLKIILLFVLAIVITGIECYIFSLGDFVYSFFLEHIIWFKRYATFFLGFSFFYILVFFNFFVKIKDYLKIKEMNIKLNCRIIRILKFMCNICSKKNLNYLWLIFGFILVYPFYVPSIKEVLLGKNFFVINFSGKNINLIKLWFDTGLSVLIIRNVVRYICPRLVIGDKEK